MEKTINLKITESQAKTFESLLDKILEILNRMEKESPERDKRKAQMQKSIDENIAEAQKNMLEVDKKLKKILESR